ncbi:hypothetical protein HDV00_006755 [Rhizophlyctis rosea]|nr:hypothetical protein HDV00_006755 [Rhizophlyctis rosea]
MISSASANDAWIHDYNQDIPDPAKLTSRASVSSISSGTNISPSQPYSTYTETISSTPPLTHSGGHTRESSDIDRTPFVTPADPDDLPEDGPQFRSRIADLEKRTSNLKQCVKKILKQAETLFDTVRKMLAATSDFVDAFGPLAQRESPSVKQGCEVMQTSQNVIHEKGEKLLDEIESLVIAPLYKIYDIIKKAEPRKKEFDHDSAEYNALQEKYISIKGHSKKRNESDTKYLKKSIQWATKRYDYYVFLSNLHGTDMDTQLSFIISVFLEKQSKFFRDMAGVLAKKSESSLKQLNEVVGQTSKTASMQRKDQDERRKIIETRGLGQGGGVGDGGVGVEDWDVGSPLTPSPHGAKFQGIRDLAPMEDTSVYGVSKQGYLLSYAAQKVGDMKAPSGHLTWKKLWCVIKRGKLMEHNHKTPFDISLSIDLQTCTVREAHSVNRRFCFEIISPHVGRRVYQAMDAESCKAWMAVIQNAIERSLEQKHPSRDVWMEGGKVDMSKMEKETNEPPKVLDLIWEIDEGNKLCADCGAKAPVWASLNLGCVVCIECSGYHRGLGVHISKIRSLTLDNKNWTPDLLAVFRAIGNTHSNEIWEATLRSSGASRPKASDAREARMVFAKEKYVNRQWVERPPQWPPAGRTLPEHLTECVESNDILAVLRAIALGADLNASTDTRRPLIHAAFGYPEIAGISGRRRGSVDADATSELTRFAMAEFLLQNGCNSDAVDKTSLEEVGGILGFDGQMILPLRADGKVNGENGAFPAVRRMTCLQYAALYLDVDAVAYLVSKGADPSLKDALGKTPLDLVEVGRRWRERDEATSPGDDFRSARELATQCEDKLRQALAKNFR